MINVTLFWQFSTVGQVLCAGKVSPLSATTCHSAATAHRIYQPYKCATQQKLGADLLLVPSMLLHLSAGTFLLPAQHIGKHEGCYYSGVTFDNKFGCVYVELAPGDFLVGRCP